MTALVEILLKLEFSSEYLFWFASFCPLKSKNKGCLKSEVILQFKTTMLIFNNFIQSERVAYTSNFSDLT